MTRYEKCNVKPIVTVPRLHREGLGGFARKEDRDPQMAQREFQRLSSSVFVL
jgi:hypothetical protein